MSSILPDNAPCGNFAQQLLPISASPQFVSIRSALANAKSLDEARSIQARISAAQPSALIEDTRLGNSMIQTLVGLGGTRDARAAFGKLKNKDATTWSLMICGYVKNNQHRSALNLYWKMADVLPNEAVFTAVLESCAVLQMPKQGIAVHAEMASIEDAGIVKNFKSEVLGMYIRCHCVECARVCFDWSDNQDPATWTTMIAAYAQAGYFDETLDLYEKMVARGIRPGTHARRCALTACSAQHRLALGISILGQEEVEAGLENAVLDLLARCGDLERAWNFFGKMNERDVVSWNTMLWSLVNRGLHRQALELFREMDLQGVETNLFSLKTIARVCSTSLVNECCGVYDCEP